MAYVLVGRDDVRATPSLVIGPYEQREDAAEMKGTLERTTKGIYTVLPMHTPEKF